MRRSLLGLALSLLLPLAAGCSDSGKLRVIWTFSSQPAVEPPSMAYQCGMHRVDSVRLGRGTVTFLDGGADGGMDAGEDAGVDGGAGADWEGRWEDVTGAPCTPNLMEREVSPGIYDFMLWGVNATGKEIQVPGHPYVLHTPIFAVQIKSGQTTELPLVLDTSGCDGINCRP